LLLKYSISAQTVVSAQEMVSSSWDECGNPLTQNFTPFVELFMAVSEDANVLLINALGEITFRPIM
jgi:hypothetical protein